MIETCPKKCMLIGTVTLVLLTVFVLILESQLASESVLPSSASQRNKQFPTENNSTCWQHQEYTLVSECHPCTAYEIKSKSIGVCIHTHYKEVLRCKSGEIVTRSCDRVAYLEETAFWKFMAWSFIIGAISSLAVMFRIRFLNRKALHRAHLQLANGIS
ncbi:jumping translocation breakpoint protein JTBR [Arctopsyche grandis]|uniref:jumping translocation breakpoint protein JTBR n=1 Tax=Arctopsyche grandis TaxID=121162 RepID=UPI00406D903C